MARRKKKKRKKEKSKQLRPGPHRGPQESLKGFQIDMAKRMVQALPTESGPSA
jgi:hypothetical protein